MIRTKLLGLFVVLGCLFGAARSASAANYIVYLHGRSMQTWPGVALFGPPSGWSHVTLSYNGSASLGDTGIQTTVNNAIAAYCGGGNQCIVVCFNAGCARMLLSYRQLRDQGRYPSGILWSEAAGSAAGGSELSVFATKWYVRLLAKIFGMEQAAPIDYDIQPNTMRSGTYATIQGAAGSPVYHLAGSTDICQTISILWLFRVKMCGNKYLPGGYGDGVVPVHSAAGYADAGAHSSHQDGGSKYVFRAYEQTPLFSVDHRGIFGPLVSLGSLRLGVNQTVTCPNMPTIPAVVPDASIVYDDGDGAFTEESSPFNMLVVCGSNYSAGQQPLYATCLTNQACCTSFSTGSAGGCACGEALCKQAQVATRSYYTNADCTGTEYGEVFAIADYRSFDGLGMNGEQVASSVTVRSARVWPSGVCQQLGYKVCYGSGGYCCDTYATTYTLTSARRVYRPAGAPPPPSGTGDFLVVRSTSYPHSQCP